MKYVCLLVMKIKRCYLPGHVTVTSHSCMQTLLSGVHTRIFMMGRGWPVTIRDLCPALCDSTQNKTKNGLMSFFYIITVVQARKLS
jgi:hypothetical protein